MEIRPLLYSLILGQPYQQMNDLLQQERDELLGYVEGQRKGEYVEEPGSHHDEIKHLAEVVDQTDAMIREYNQLMEGISYIEVEVFQFPDAWGDYQGNPTSPFPVSDKAVMHIYLEGDRDELHDQIIRIAESRGYDTELTYYEDKPYLMSWVHYKRGVIGEPYKEGDLGDSIKFSPQEEGSFEFGSNLLFRSEERYQESRLESLDIIADLMNHLLGSR